MADERLHIIALISGGKDSFFSLVHCLRNGHRVVALANLYPPRGGGVGGRTREADSGTAQVNVIEPGDRAGPQECALLGAADSDAEETDLNSFMYQTVGHQVIPLYAQATRLPLYRRVITGGATQSARDYDGNEGSRTQKEREETESMTELLKAVMKNHPEANAVCAGAILSTYQRTRVESVAVRLGLVPVAYLWKYPILPPPRTDDAGITGKPDEAQLLNDMATAGLDARIIKVASAGLDEDFLWTTISSPQGIAKARRALRHFGGGGEGAILGEGGEFETIVVDGPRELFKGRIVVGDEGRKIVKEGGGCSWLRFTQATVEPKSEEKSSDTAVVRVPDVLDTKFAAILEEIGQRDHVGTPIVQTTRRDLRLEGLPRSPSSDGLQADEEVHWGCLADRDACTSFIEQETQSVVEKLQGRLGTYSAKCITSSIVILRRMADFPAVNKVYGTLFAFPNPPSRVTISCGDLLPEGHNIRVYVTFRPRLHLGDRNGLHVQSRSYWAPANIGPYSQAVDVPASLTASTKMETDAEQATTSSASKAMRIVSIAGQIPLVPSTMELPKSLDTSLNLQIILSLQHLWRIGTEMQVQLWTSAVAYFPRAQSSEDMKGKAKLAARVWRSAHVGTKVDGDGDSDDDDDDDDQGGPDLWDKRYNPEYMTFGGKEAGPKALPEWDVFDRGPEGKPVKQVPPFFAVEVEELPRQAGIEWHAHAGLSRVQNGSVQVGRCSCNCETQRLHISWRASYMLVKAEGGQTFLHTTLAIDQGEGSVASIAGVLDMIREASLAQTELQGSHVVLERQSRPYLIYGAIGAAHVVEMQGDGNISSEQPFVPCRSIWDEEGKPIAVVALFRDSF
ncbi:hypothetical protein jhhlp_007370 [Lomentospora prolificans]|uniref:Diphthine--ammonia ligase n=1 Tax=Lomentospora prolificans TaxID=41688 RepID=A0A2N3N2G7_9PEZI|nr:hypothetical protein jhhlp_007370 [Lomentospora prolificans]